MTSPTESLLIEVSNLRRIEQMDFDKMSASHVGALFYDRASELVHHMARRISGFPNGAPTVSVQDVLQYEFLDNARLDRTHMTLWELIASALMSVSPTQIKGEPELIFDPTLPERTVVIRITDTTRYGLGPQTVGEMRMQF